VAEITMKRPGRNDPCHCGSGNKYKRCCLNKDEAAEREARAEAAAEAADTSAEEESVPDASDEPDAPQSQRSTDQPWKRSVFNYQPFQRHKTPRKRGGG